VAGASVSIAVLGAAIPFRSKSIGGAAVDDGHLIKKLD